HRGDELGVLGRRTDHRGAADVDVLDDLLVGHSAPGGGALERVEVHAHQVDELHVVLTRRLHVPGVVTDGEDSRVELRVKRLDAAVHDLGKAGESGDLAHGDAGFGELA